MYSLLTILQMYLKCGIHYREISYISAKKQKQL